MGIFLSHPSNLGLITCCVDVRKARNSAGVTYYPEPLYRYDKIPIKRKPHVDHSHDMPANEVEWNALGDSGPDLVHRYHHPLEYTTGNISS